MDADALSDLSLAEASEHLRQHGRLTVADLEVTQLIRSFHRGDGDPAVRHLLWAGALDRAGDD